MRRIELKLKDNQITYRGKDLGEYCSLYFLEERFSGIERDDERPIFVLVSDEKPDHRQYFEARINYWGNTYETSVILYGAEKWRKYDNISPWPSEIDELAARVFRKAPTLYWWVELEA